MGEGVIIGTPLYWKVFERYKTAIFYYSQEPILSTEACFMIPVHFIVIIVIIIICKGVTNDLIFTEASGLQVPMASHCPVYWSSATLDDCRWTLVNTPTSTL